MKDIKLSNQNLSQISGQVKVPTYDRSKIKTGIVHVGIGGFHRAHQAFYTDQLLHTQTNSNWGICGVGLLEFDKKIMDILKEQDGLYTLIVKELDGTLSKTVVGSITEYLFAPENPTAVIEKMADPNVKIITLTITEGGYNYNKAKDEFDAQHPLIQHDLENPKSPKTIFGYLTQALKLRKAKNLNGCTIQSCDNIQGNGHFAKRMLLSFVKLADPDLLPWIAANVSFPNSMVDRITPVTAPSDISALRESDGIVDRWPVVCEPFKQWIIEDEFITGRPPWEEVGAQFVKDVEPYENMKLSLLNAGHSVLGILGALIGYTTIDETIRNPNLHTFLRNFMNQEVTPVLGNTEGINLDNYKSALIQRFGNIYIKDQVDRICSESSAKLPIFLLPTIEKQLKQKGVIEHAALVVAAWAIYSLGVDENGNSLNIKDDLKDLVKEKALLAAKNPALFLDLDIIFGNLKSSELFVKAYTKSYQNITEHGIEKSVISINQKK